MQEPNSRAARRRHAARLKRNRRGYHGDYVRSLPPDEQALHLGRFLNTIAACSCVMCGNPRKYLGDATLQENSHSELAQWEE